LRRHVRHVTEGLRIKLGVTFVLGAAVCFLAVWAYGREVSVTLLYTADLHGHLGGVLSDREAERGGGLLRCASLIRTIRQQEPNVLLIDGGDLFQGSAESYLTRGDVVIDAVKALRYDALVTGNHEFDWGVANLVRLYTKANIPVLAANITSDTPPAGKRYPWKPFLVTEMGGARVVIVGLANPLTPGWIRPRLLDGLRFDQSVATLRRVLPAAREQHPDALVLAAHQGYRQWGDNAANEINAITRAFPELDVILGAHTHASVEGLELQDSAYIQPGCHGLWLAIVRLKIDTERHCVTKRTAELIPVDSAVKPDPALESSCAGAMKDAQAYLNREIGRAAGQLLAQSRFPGQSQVQTLIARAILDAVEADVVFHGTLTEGSLAMGRITMRDVWRIVPYENTIGVAQLTLGELKEILEENSRYLNSDQFRGVYGVTYAIVKPKSAKSGNCEVQKIRLTDGHVLQEGDRIRVAFNSHDLAAAGVRFPRLREIVDRPTSRLEETAVDTREAVIAYIRKHQPLKEEAGAGARIVRESRSR